MGYVNAVSLDRLKKEADDGGFDAVIHAGGNGIGNTFIMLVFAKELETLNILVESVIWLRF